MIAILRSILAATLALFIGIISQSHLNAEFRPANPDDPADYLPRIDRGFFEFWEKHHYFPSYWRDFQVDCRKDSAGPICDVERTRSERERRTLTFPKSKYVYLIVKSSVNQYRVVAIDNNGCERFYIDQHRKAEIINSKC